MLWRAHPGPQSKFLSSPAFEVGYGGRAGGGKTDALIAGRLRQTPHPLYRGIIFRRTFPELQELMDRAAVLYPQLGATWNDRDKRWTFPSGGKVEFGYCASYSEVLQYQTDEFTEVCYDQLDQLPEERIWTYLSSRVRAKAADLRLGMFATFNPGGVGGQWIKRRFVDVCPEDGSPISVEHKTPDGRVVRTTRAFVRAGMADNPALLRNDPGYADRLAMLTEVEYRQLALGDWEAQGGAFYPEITTQADQDRLFISPQQVPPLLDWYEYWGAYDWGFIHPACYSQFVRIKDTVLVLDSTFMFKYQDEEQASLIRGTSDKRCLRVVYAGHDAFAKRQAHSAAAETVADIFGRYGIALEKASIDREAGSKAVRRMIAKPKPGPALKGSLTMLFVDTPGNRRVVGEMAALIPEETHPNVPAKRNADENGQWGDDGADTTRYGVASPSFEPTEPARPFFPGNVETGVDVAFWEQEPRFTVTVEGQVDKREFAMPHVLVPDAYFPEDQ